jgi:hypothetical protein
VSWKPVSIVPVFSDSMAMMTSGITKKISSQPSPGRSRR